MKIAINAINSNRNPRGPDRYLTELLRALLQRDQTNKYVLFHSPWQGWYAKELQGDNLELVELASPGCVFARVPWQAAIFPRLIRKHRPDLVHIPNTVYMRKSGYRVILTIHDLAEYDFPEKFSHFRAGVRKILGRRAIANCDCVVAVSEFTRAAILRTFKIPEHRVTHVTEGVTLLPEVSDCGAVLGRLGVTKPYFLYVGVIEKTKNIERVIRAFHALGGEFQDRFALVLAGHPGNAHNDVSELIKTLKLNQAVHYLGFVTEDSLSCLFRNAVAFVFPSLVEGFGLVIAEAMGYGAPVITSNSGALAEVAGDAAFAVDPYSADEIAAAMLQLATDPAARDRLRTKGLERSRRYSWDLAARQMLRVYENVHAGPNHCGY